MGSQRAKRKRKDGAEDKVNETEEQSNPTWNIHSTHKHENENVINDLRFLVTEFTDHLYSVTTPHNSHARRGKKVDEMKTILCLFTNKNLSLQFARLHLQIPILKFRRELNCLREMSKQYP